MDSHCEKIQNQMADYILGILDQEEIEIFNQHIGNCQQCREHLQSLEKENRLLMQFGRNLEVDMSARQGRAIEALRHPRPTAYRNTNSIWSIMMHKRITKLAAAAVVAVALLIPLSYGMSNIIKKLIAGSVEVDDYQGDFALSKDIRIELEVGTKEQQNIVSAHNIRFFTEDNELRGTLRCRIRCMPKYKWMTTIELLDTKDKKLASTEHVNENAGVEVSYQNSSPRDIHFSVGRWSNVSQAQKFRISFKKVPEDIETTPDAWVESSELDVVHGRVTGPDGKPIANSLIQIRQKIEPGQSGIVSPDIITDEHGFYSFDGINWQYRVRVLFYEPDADSQDYRYQYKRLNKELQGNQTVDFKFGNFPTGSAAIVGKVESPDGQVIKEFLVNVRLEVDFEDYSSEHSYQYGYSKPFITEDGKFEISDLPAGVYDVTIYPTINETLEYIERKQYVCELHEGQRKEIGTDNTKGKILYGRVLFEDETPAVSQLEGFETQIVEWSQDSTSGATIATVDQDGYFRTQISNEVLERLKSGKVWIVVGIARSDIIHNFQTDERFPVEFLSLKRDTAGVIKIDRPNIYYGRVLYENGMPLILEVLPWKGATVSAGLRYSPKGAANLVTERIRDVDKEGYFFVYLTDTQIEQIKAGNYSIEIFHPSYIKIGSCYLIKFPFESLSTEKESVEGYTILFDQIKVQESENLHQVLKSVDKLKELSAAWEKYANDRQNIYPDIMQQLEKYIEDLQWFIENAEYLGNRVDTTLDPAETVLAYDKALLEKYGSTLVLFRDGHIEFCWPRQLEILGILETGIEESP